METDRRWLIPSLQILINKMAKDKIQMPSSMGGLVRYFDEYKSKISFKPGHVVVLILAVIIIVIILHVYGRSLLGF